MSELDLLVLAERAVLPDGAGGLDVRPAAVGVRDGRIAVVVPLDHRGDLPRAERVLELGDDEVLLPGLVDTHVHINEPGRTAWEGFDTATRAAALGGVTTVIDMPLNSIPATTTVGALRLKHEAARGAVHVDVGFWGGVVPGNTGELAGLVAGGVFGAKCFTTPSGVDEFEHVNPAQLREGLAELARLGSRLLVHAEDPAVLDEAAADVARRVADGADPRSFALFLASRPAAAEDSAVADVIAAVREVGGAVHVVHLASASALPLVAAARAEGLAVTAETCPHYLTLDAAAVPDGATQFKCCPPVRDASVAGELWAALEAGVLDSVVSDHSPCTPDLKLLEADGRSGDFLAAWGGIASVQLGLPVVWTAARERGVPLERVVEWMAARPAARVGLAGRKGSLVVGADADFAVLAPEEELLVDPGMLAFKNKVTPYAGRTLRGTVRSTWLRGTRLEVADPSAAPGGRLLHAVGQDESA
ncbi:allantoinase [Quadrisphaera granulorum]|uniref:allantoinase n=1 Tax=Quadrisphaera granulorum TaxID=317664 RepID=A0A316AS39_9ACTN|nr:allantoinase AllB [Quadrisphaera granulorum]PWJ52927.1 allantoinase [Quadrisphaera granulorum]SZE97309.1 allantoinase [Quadrisphaera granulorum]